ncbi:Abi family protein [Shewanella colwelliana]|uniref:Abi family protein n=1 Tax=Shewanella colwelliana TaxID=23 RepID=UPI0022B01F4F|nr:Abi family protein [Shewanella colwelliana]MCZ4339767.1 Abi family protein [Shewanella colwelliana]
MQAQDYLNLQQDISLPRLSSYQHFFKPKEPTELYGYYCWNEAISAALFRLIGIVEITLRNKLHCALSQHYYNPKSLGSKQSNDWYSSLALNKRSEENILKVTHTRKKGKWQPKHLTLSHDDVISRLTYGFWPKVLDITKDKQNQLVPWGKIIPNVIPHHRQKNEGYWKKTKHQDTLYARLEMIGSLRNRIAHFEPIWKQGALFEETRERQNKQPKKLLNAPINAKEALCRLILIHERIQEQLGWLSHSRLKSYQNSYTHRQLSWLLSPKGMETYLCMQGHTPLSQSKVKRRLTNIIKQQKTITITKNGEVSGVFYPIR